MTPTFTPSKGSPCDKAFMAIRIHGARVSRQAMAVALEVDEEEVDGLLGYPLRIGALAKVEDAGVVWFDVGDGKPEVAPPAPAREPAKASPGRWAPDASSVAGRALQALKGRGWVRARDLAALIDAHSTALPGSLEKTIAQGLIETDVIGPNRYYFLPDERDAKPAAPEPLRAPKTERTESKAPPAGPVGDGSQKPDDAAHGAAPELAAKPDPEPVIPQFVKPRRRVEMIEDDEILVGGAAPTHPEPRTHRIEFPIPNKSSVKLELPPDFDARDWKFLQQVFTAYANRLAPVAA